VRVETVDSGRFRLRGDASASRGTWELMCDGEVVDGGELRDEPEFELDLGVGTEGERFVTFRFFLREPRWWAPAGHEVAWDQIPLPSPPRRDEIAGGDVPFVVDEATGKLAEVGGVQLDGPRLQLWRAPTDNDGLRLLPERRHGVLWRWLELGLDRLQERLETIDRSDDGVVEAVSHASGRERWDDVRHVRRYRSLASGELLVEHELAVGPDLRDLPRVGAVFVLPAGLERLEWYGLGPWESYPDRCASAIVGRFRSTVADQYVPYILPQEHGHHSDARWLTLTDERAFGLKVRGRPTIGFSASHYHPADLYAARHTCELEPRAETVLSLDHAQRGLGTASCGPDTAPRHRLTEPTYRFAYTLRSLG
jgi:beta-galactosidase